MASASAWGARSACSGSGLDRLHLLIQMRCGIAWRLAAGNQASNNGEATLACCNRPECSLDAAAERTKPGEQHQGRAHIGGDPLRPARDLDGIMGRQHEMIGLVMGGAHQNAI